MSEKCVCFNGVNGATGDYRFPPMDPRQFSRDLQGQPPDKEYVEELEHRLEVLTREHLGPHEDVDPRELSESGWGVVFAEGTDPAVRQALRELVEHRRRDASRIHERRFREITYRPGETEWEFLDRHEAGFGPADPDKVPYYLMLVGDAGEIPYDFQHELDVEYAVGRLAFDTAEEYAAYAAAVVAAERAGDRPAPTACFFAAKNPDDPATEQSHDFFVEPLAEILDRSVDRAWADWRIETRLAGRATKEDLGHLLGGAETPAFLLSASHGIFYPNGNPAQRERQGALLCQDWPGPKAWNGRGLLEDHYFAAHDLSRDARLDGLVVFHFGCYGAGTSALGSFPMDRSEPAAPRDFVARLPQRLLAQGALAVVSHVDESWSYSYIGLRGGERLETFESTLLRLLEGHPVGSAMDYMNRRYAHLSVALSKELDAVHRLGKRADDERLTRLWTARQDARNYVVLGDPAVRLPVARKG